MRIELEEEDAIHLAGVLSSHEDARVRALAASMARPLELALLMERLMGDGAKKTTDGTGAARMALDSMGWEISESQAFRIWKNWRERTPISRASL